MSEIKKFLGLRNTTAPERLKPGELEVAENMDLDNTFKLLSRRGTTQLSATASHSAYATDTQILLMQDYDMKRLEADDSLVQVARLSSNRPVSYAQVGEAVYFTNGSDTGKIVNRSYSAWGVNPPVSQPAAAPTIGDLPPGRYLYALTFLRSDGYESGTGAAGLVELTGTGGGIAFSAVEVSTNPGVSGRILYLSSPNGEVLYRVAVIDNVSQSYIYLGSGFDLTAPLETQFMGPPPAGTLVEIYNGVAFVVVGNVVYYSEPYQLELFRKDHFLQFPGPVVMFNAVNDGVYVGTHGPAGVGQTWFLEGGRPDQFRQRLVFDYGAVQGTAVETDAGYFEDEATAEQQGEGSRPAVLWLSSMGVCVGADGGAVRNLTEAKYSFPSAARGAGLLRLERGYAQYLVAVQGAGSAVNAYQ